jgi:N6-L-threonylcarbamoyladenine synthase
MLILGIETTCDETAAAVVRDGQEMLSNVISSQVDLHRLYGGVFPELACRRHIDLLLPVIQEALATAGVEQGAIDCVAVAKGPGLIGALLIGLNAAKALSLAWSKPFIGVNHVEAHLYAAMMGKQEIELPALGVVISGGHTFLVRIVALGVYERIGATVDDAVGEAFDKVAVMLGLSYPGGPAIEAFAQNGDPTRYCFKAGKVKGRPWDFSFSGMKTSVLYAIKGDRATKDSPLLIREEDKAHVAASFQEAACKEIVQKSIQAAKEFGCKAITLGGGVSNNRRLRELFSQQTIPTYWPPAGLSLDNAAMIAGLGYQLFLKNNQGDSFDLEPMPRIPIWT